MVDPGLFAQISKIGTPLIINYSRSEYQAANQNWGIQQAANGMMYFANNDGLLEFDGLFWKTYPLPNNSVVRAVRNDNDSIMYAGGFNEMGYYVIGEMGGATFHSLTDLLNEEDKDFEEVWKIYVHPDGVIFQSFRQIMIYKNNRIEVIKAPSIFHFSFLVNNEYYVNDMEKGLMRYAMNELHPLIGMEALKGKEIWGLFDYNNKLLVATASLGLFLYDGNALSETNLPANRFFRQNQIYSIVRLKSGGLVFGTIQNGCLFTDEKLSPLKNLNLNDGLQNNTILCMEEDSRGNLWLGTDHGIDYIEINSPLSLMGKSYGLSGGYAALVFNDTLYLGTNQGLFCKSLVDLNRFSMNNKEMDLVENSKGQVWSLMQFGQYLLCGHNSGSFYLNHNKLTPISDITGGWTFVQIPGFQDKIIGGTYTGISLYEKSSTGYRFIKQYPGFGESARKLLFDKDGSLWMVHGYKGAYNIFFNSTYDSIIKVNFYNAQNTSVKGQIIDLTEINRKLVFISSNGFYNFNRSTSDFVIDPYMNKLPEHKEVREITKNEQGDLWYFTQNQVGVFRLREDGHFDDISKPFHNLNNKIIRGFEFVYPYNNDMVFIGTENGFAFYDQEKKNNTPDSLKVYLKYMLAGNSDTTILYEHSGSEKCCSVKYSFNNIEFVFSSNNFENPADTRFSSFLKGYDKTWSGWENKNIREFTNLFEGNYIFQVKAINPMGEISDIIKMEFMIDPPFLRSRIAFFMYVLIVIIIVTLFVIFIKKRIEAIKLKNIIEQEKKHRAREEKLQLEALEAEKEIIRMRNEKLSTQMKQKNKELANSTMLMLQKNEVLIALKEELNKIKSQSKSQHEIKLLQKKIDNEIDSEKHWKVFETSFENVHEEFLNRIKEEYPHLTPRELKLCAYLRMNISSKEISVLMNISTRGVEISRYRLRKKIGLSREDNLTDFIISF